MKQLCAILIFVFIECSKSSFASDCLSYDKKNTQIAGYLTRVYEEQTPIESNGENRKVTRWMLTTPTPFCVEGGNQDNIAMAGASSIEILPISENKYLELLIGRNIEVSGRLLPSNIPHFHIYLIMEVEKISEVK